jgi:hypothetical protein
MRKLLIALGMLGVVVLMRPAPAAADFSLSIGLPGFGFFIHDPFPPPVVSYGPPAYYPYAPPVVYRSYPVYRPYRYRPGCRRGYYGRGYHGRGYRHGNWGD